MSTGIRGWKEEMEMKKGRFCDARMMGDGVMRIVDAR
jgi:hypothetical protein